MTDEISIAIETSCRTGALALGRGDELVAGVSFDASARHTTQLISRLRGMLAQAGLAPERLGHVYVSIGPGSFTGLRIGVTVARTMAQLLPDLKCLAVPTARAVAQNAAAVEWEHLGVVLAAKGRTAYCARFVRRDGGIVPAGGASVVEFERFCADAPRPMLLIGEGMAFFEVSAPSVSVADEGLWSPTAEGVWRVGRSLAAEGRFTDYHELLPDYGRRPEAVRLWQQRRDGKEA